MALWDIWISPLIFVIGLIILISVYSESKSKKSGPILESRDEISDTIVEHPFTLNPIILAGLIALAFMFIIIIYYAAIASY